MTTNTLLSQIQGLKALEQAHGCTLSLDFNAVQAAEVRRLLPVVFQGAETDGQYPSVETVFLALLQQASHDLEGAVITEGTKRYAEGLLNRTASGRTPARGRRSAKAPVEKK